MYLLKLRRGRAKGGCCGTWNKSPCLSRLWELLPGEPSLLPGSAIDRCPAASRKVNAMSSSPQRRQQGLEKPGPCPGLTACTCLSRGQTPAPQICRAQTLTYLLPPPSSGPTELNMCFSKFGHWPAAGHLQSRLGMQNLSRSEPRVSTSILPAQASWSQTCSLSQRPPHRTILSKYWLHHIYSS